MGARGPVGKRSDQKHGHRSKAELVTDQAPGGAPVTWLAADPEWHSIARNWYESLAVSGQSVYYEASDVATAFYVAEAMSRSLQGARFSGQLFAAIMSSMSDLVVTEGARRRVKLELQREAEGSSEVDDSIMELLGQF